MIYDLAIVGGGPAGLSAAVTAKNRNLSTVLFDPGSFGLALQKASHITNYLGFPDISGTALMQAFLDHAKKAGTEIVSEKILSIMNRDGHFYLATPSGVTEAKTVILALGIPRSAQLMGEADLVGTGISTARPATGTFIGTVPLASSVPFLPSGTKWNFWQVLQVR